MTDHAPMRVRMEATDEDMTPNPGLRGNWTDLEKLRWKAGCIQAEHGVTVNIVTGAIPTNVRLHGSATEFYGYKMTGRSGGAYTYREMWVWLNAFAIGYDMGHDDGWDLAQEAA